MLTTKRNLPKTPQLTPKGVKKFVKDTLVPGIAEALIKKKRNPKSQQEKEMARKIAQNMSTSASNMVREGAMAVKLAKQLITEDARQANPSQAVRDLARDVSKAVVALSTRVVSDMAVPAVRANPDALVPGGFLRAKVQQVRGFANSFTQMVISIARKGSQAAGRLEQSQKMAIATNARRVHGMMQWHVDQVQNEQLALEDERNRLLTLMDVDEEGYEVSDDEPTDTPGAASSSDRFAIAYNAHGATAPAPPRPFNLFEFGTPFQRVPIPESRTTDTSADTLARVQRQRRERLAAEQAADTLARVQRQRRAHLAAERQIVPSGTPPVPMTPAQKLSLVQKQRRERLAAEQAAATQAKKGTSLNEVQKQRRIALPLEKISGSTKTADELLDEMLADQQKKKAPRTGKGISGGAKEVLNIPPPILEYFDVKNDPHFIRAHRPTAPK